MSTPSSRTKAKANVEHGHAALLRCLARASRARSRAQASTASTSGRSRTAPCAPPTCAESTSATTAAIAGNGDRAVEEGRHRHLVGGVQHRRRRLAGRRAPRRPGRGRGSARGRGPRSRGGRSRARSSRGRPAGSRSGYASAYGDRHAHVRQRRAAPAPSRPRTPPASARWTAGARPRRRCSGGTSKSQRASITSSPLFISVAESMVIFGPMSQVGCAQRLRRRRRARCAPRGQVRNGPPEAVSTSRAHVLAPVPGAGTGRSRCARCPPAAAPRPLRAGRAGPARPPSRAPPCWPGPRRCRPRSRPGSARARRPRPARTPPGRPARGPRRRAPRRPPGSRVAGPGGVRPAGARPPRRRRDTTIGSEAPHLLRQLRHVAPGGQRHDPEALGEDARHRQGLLADAAGAAEDGQPLHSSSPAPPQTWALVSPKRRSRDWKSSRASTRWPLRKSGHIRSVT